MDLRYNSEDRYREINTEQYIQNFNDEERFLGLCKQCSNYGRFWVCPPFSFNPIEKIRQFSNILIICTRITPSNPELPITAVSELMRPERIRLEKVLLKLEQQFKGYSLAFAGNCLHCPGEECTRKKGLSCRHPELARPSIESFGFDVGKTLKELFGYEILWGQNGKIPEYLTLVSALLHNEDYLDPKSYIGSPRDKFTT